MEWTEERLKRVEKFAARREEQRRARSWKLIRVLAIITTFGAILVFLDLASRSRQSASSLNFLDPKTTMDNWVESGFVTSVDERTATAVLDEEMWNEMSEGKKGAVVALLQSYFAQRGDDKELRVTIKGNSSGQLLRRSGNPPVNRR